MEIYVPGLIDPAKEKARLEARKAKLAEDLRKTEAKLGNEGFVARAPADVVEKEKAKLAELRAQIESLQAGLEALD
jgi:valyl-tRNA synthetase